MANRLGWLGAASVEASDVARCMSRGLVLTALLAAAACSHEGEAGQAPRRAVVGQSAALTATDHAALAQSFGAQAYYWARERVATNANVKDSTLLLAGGGASPASESGGADGQATEFKAAPGGTPNAEVVVRISDFAVQVTNVLARVNAPYGEHCGGLGCVRMYVQYSLDGVSWGRFGDVVQSTLHFAGLQDSDGWYWVGLRVGNVGPVTAKYLKFTYQSNGAIPGGPSSLVDVVAGLYAPPEPSVQESPPDSCVQSAWTAFVGNPINTYSGSESEPALDLSIPTAGPALELARMYNSKAAESGTVGLLGAGWGSKELELRLELGPASAAASAAASVSGSVSAQVAASLPRVRGHWAMAHVAQPPYVSSGLDSGSGCPSYVPPAGVRAQLSCVDANRDGAPEYYEWSVGCGGVRYRFDPSGKLTAKRTLEGHAVSYEYGDSSNPSRITRLSAGSRFITLSYDAQGRLSIATDHAGRSVRYSYDSNGLLSAVVDVRGATTTYQYDAAKRLTAVTNALGESLTNQYDAQGRVVLQREGVTASNPSGLMQRTLSYSAVSGQPYAQETAVSDGEGRTVRYRYDGQGKLIQVLDASGATTSYLYDGRKNVRQVTDPLGRITQLETSVCGKHTAVTRYLNGRALTVRSSYNGYGLPTQVRVPVDASSVRTTQYLYDDSAHPWRLTRITRPDGLTTPATQYNAQGLVSAESDLNGGVTQYRYHPSNTGELTELELPLLNGQRSVRRFSYNTLGALTQEVDPLGTTVAAVTYDAAGLPRAVQGPAGAAAESTLRYDSVGRLIETTSPASGVTRFAYDSAGRMTSSTVGAGTAQEAVTRFSYDRSGKLVRVIDPSGVMTERRYDSVGRLSAVVVPAQGALPERRVTLSYDSAGQLITSTNPISGTTTTSYDSLGRAVAVTVGTGTPLAATTRYSYNDAGELLSVTDAKGAVTQYAYNALGQLTAVQDALGGLTRYSYNAAGQLTHVTDAMGRARTFSYDAHGHTVSEDDAAPGVLWSAVYDVAGRMVRRTDGDGRTVNYSYNALSRLTRLDAPGSVDDITFSYGAAGRLASMSNAAGSSDFGYDALGRLTGVVERYPTLKNITYSYDAAGRLTSRAAALPNFGAIYYSYDAQGRLKELDGTNLGSEFLVRYQYDAEGRLTQSSSASGQWRTQYSYDGLGRVTSKNAFAGTSGAPYAAHSISYDALGNVTRETQKIGTDLLRAYDSSYDALSRLVARSTTQGSSSIDYERFSYDKSGNRTALESLASVESYLYDAANRLTTWASRAQNGGPVVVTKTRKLRYDQSGNLLSDGERSFRYNALHQLIEQSVLGTYPDFQDDMRTYRYDGRGLLRSESATNESHAYQWEALGGDSPALMALDGEALLFGPDELIGVGRAQTPSNARFTLTDARGSVLGKLPASSVASGAPTLSDSQRYSSFGQAQSPLASTALGFTGEPQDPHGLVYLRARHYDSRTGRFLQMDPLMGSMGAPSTQSAYAYALNNPGTLADHSGRWVNIAIGAVAGGIGGYLSCPTGDYGCIAASTAVGALTAGVGGFVGGALGKTIAPALGAALGAGLGTLIGNMAVGAASGAASAMTANLLTRPCSEVGTGVAAAAGWGAVTGAVGWGIGRLVSRLYGPARLSSPPPKAGGVNQNDIDNLPDVDYRDLDYTDAERQAIRATVSGDFMSALEDGFDLPMPQSVNGVVDLLQDVLVATEREPGWFRNAVGGVVRLGTRYSVDQAGMNHVIAHGQGGGSLAASSDDLFVMNDFGQLSTVIFGPTKVNTISFSSTAELRLAYFAALMRGE